MARINKVIELIEQGQPVYAIGARELSYEAGRDQANTWADLILVDFEHHAFDVAGLTKFMRGLKEGGPTPSGHLTPTVISTLPSNCMSREEVIYNAWQARHVLSTGVHGILHTHARDPEAVRAFVSITRYPFQTIGRERGISEGLRGSGGGGQSAVVWGVSRQEYVRKADPWPLNPNGELMLGLKIEDRHCLANADAIAGTPGIAFAEWGPGDMGMSFGSPNAHDPPYSPLMDNARNTVKAACDRAGIAFYCGWSEKSMTEEQRVRFLIEEIGAKIMGAPTRAFADIGRRLTGRVMPV
jgi:4-hydroxy-2-oxoheptanedioate aldolase